MDVRELAEELAASEVVTLDDGRVVRLKIEHDGATNVNHFDCYGRVEYGRVDRYTGWEVRPPTFDGTAVKMSVGRHESLWWMPYLPTKEDRRRWATDADLRRRECRFMADLLEMGFAMYVIEVLGGSDAYGRPIVEDYDILAGCDSWDASDHVDYLADMLAGLGLGGAA